MGIAKPPPHLRPPGEPDDDEPLVDPGRPLVLRVLGLCGALSFLLIGLSSLAPVLQPASPPAPMPDQRDGQPG